MKFYTIRLTEAGKNLSIPLTGVPNAPTRELEIRSFEVDVLTNLFDFAAANTKKASETNLCIDCQAQLEELRNSEGESFRMSRSDYDLLIQGFEKSMGQRPFIWTKLRDLFRQIEKPEEEEIDLNKKKD